MAVKIGMKWSSAISTESDTDKALDEALAKVGADLHGEKPDVVFLFVSPQHKKNYARIGAAVVKFLDPRHMLGCSGGAVIGDAHVDFLLDVRAGIDQHLMDDHALDGHA